MKQNLNHLKPGLYAVWYFDCWDVDGDLYYTLATGTPTNSGVKREQASICCDTKAIHF